MAYRFILVVALLAGPALAGEPTPETFLLPIYGHDDRAEVYTDPSATRRLLADSTVAMMPASVLIATDHATSLVQSSSYDKEFGLCTDDRFGERFLNQKTAADCSAFLVAPDRVATAGHCVFTPDECQNNRFVFGYMLRAADSNPYEIPAGEIYSCKRIVASQKPIDEKATTPDFAIIELDRPVTNHAPLRIRQSGVIEVGDPLYVIGYPSGLPAKIAGGARVRQIQDGVLIANLDTYGGNSGSAVFNARTNEVEGILVEGEEDFKTVKLDAERTCKVSLTCEDSGCSGESSTLIAHVLPYLHD